ncbi:hypothetical protein [Papillibacter cinnamivorans]|uniref:Lipoprotein n=1 Tax=Papillibacter cinnamivorans DSM 12816 TaxID=1122930 RepID=A0A1W1YDH0_9FIRM|nr:hypothetical protein [Papillibacter cinnamivorans]SMC34174.1 hypothetical protein SAMN02745168_0348 [Papillibacter cinnamivorans DSM 12816]
MRKKMTKPGLILLAVLMAIFTASCGGSAATAAPTGTEAAAETTPAPTETQDVQVNYNEDEQKVEFSSKDGSMHYEVGLEGGVTIPDGYPTELAPLYPEGLVTLAGYQDNVYTLAIETDDDLSSIYDFYKDNLTFDSDELSQKSDNMVLLSGKSEGMEISMMANINPDSDSEGNLITIVVVTAEE